MSEFNKNWYIVPNHIRKLPGMTLALLDFYETIFEFWNNGQKCILKNETIMERTGIKSKSTIQEAFVYFEKNNVMKRVMKGNQRYLVQVLKVETNDDGPASVDKSNKSSIKSDQGLGTASGGSRPTETQGLAPARHNNNKLKDNNINKKLLYEKDQKKHKPVDNPKEKMPHPAKTAKEPSGLLKEYMSQRKLE